MGTRQDESVIKVLVVDDHELFRRGVVAVLRSTPGVCVVGEAGNGRDALESFQAFQPDVTLLDIHMPICNGLETARKMRQTDPNTKILMLTVSETEEMLFEAVKSGASGYVLKSVSPEQLVECVRRVYEGEPVVPSSLAMKMIAEFSRVTAGHAPSNRSVTELTEREREVLQYLSAGASNKEIAKALFISENTVRNHVRHILEKLHLSNRAQAAAYAVRNGLSHGRQALGDE
ncbi:MAG: response regulator transcription factor [Alicyclobacillus sp.]|nr:response regulator transcription factor [Alicyclobacillus sp.]